MLTDARRNELRCVAEGWTGLAVLFSPVPCIGERLSDFCHRRAGKYYALAFGPLSEEFTVRLTTLIENFSEARRGA